MGPKVTILDYMREKKDNKKSASKLNVNIDEPKKLLIMPGDCVEFGNSKDIKGRVIPGGFGRVIRVEGPYLFINDDSSEEEVKIHYSKVIEQITDLTDSPILGEEEKEVEEEMKKSASSSSSSSLLPKRKSPRNLVSNTINGVIWPDCGKDDMVLARYFMRGTNAMNELNYLWMDGFATIDKQQKEVKLYLGDEVLTIPYPHRDLIVEVGGAHDVRNGGRPIHVKSDIPTPEEMAKDPTKLLDVEFEWDFQNDGKYWAVVVGVVGDTLNKTGRFKLYYHKKSIGINSQSSPSSTDCDERSFETLIDAISRYKEKLPTAREKATCFEDSIPVVKGGNTSISPLNNQEEEEEPIPNDNLPMDEENKPSPSSFVKNQLDSAREEMKQKYKKDNQNTTKNKKKAPTSKKKNKKKRSRPSKPYVPPQTTFGPQSTTSSSSLSSKKWRRAIDEEEMEKDEEYYQGLIDYFSEGSKGHRLSNGRAEKEEEEEEEEIVGHYEVYKEEEEKEVTNTTLNGRTSKENVGEKFEEIFKMIREDGVDEIISQIKESYSLNLVNGKDDDGECVITQEMVGFPDTLQLGISLLGPIPSNLAVNYIKELILLITNLFKKYGNSNNRIGSFQTWDVLISGYEKICNMFSSMTGFKWGKIDGNWLANSLLTPCIHCTVNNSPHFSTRFVLSTLKLIVVSSSRSTITHVQPILDLLVDNHLNSATYPSLSLQPIFNHLITLISKYNFGRDQKIPYSTLYSETHKANTLKTVIENLYAVQFMNESSTSFGSYHQLSVKWQFFATEEESEQDNDQSIAAHTNGTLKEEEEED